MITFHLRAVRVCDIAVSHFAGASHTRARIVHKRNHARAILCCYATPKVAHEGSSRVRDKTAFAWNVGQ